MALVGHYEIMISLNMCIMSEKFWTKGRMGFKSSENKTKHVLIYPFVEGSWKSKDTSWNNNNKNNSLEPWTPNWGEGEVYYKGSVNSHQAVFLQSVLGFLRYPHCC
jgi:hypothetical protein